MPANVFKIFRMNLNFSDKLLPNNNANMMIQREIIQKKLILFIDYTCQFTNPIN